jgi:hypothetical protein
MFPNKLMRRHMRWSTGLLAIGMLVTIGSPAVIADEASERKAAELLDNYVEITGGQAAYKAVKSRVVKAEVAAMGMTATLEMYVALPDKFYTVIEIPGVDGSPGGRIEQGWNGEVAWMLIPGMGPRILEGAEKATAIRDSTLDRFAHWRQLFHTVDYVGEESVEGRRYHKLVLIPKPLDLPLEQSAKGSPVTVLIDPDSGLISQYAAEMTTPQGKAEVVVLLADYKPVDGIKLAHKTTIRGQDFERVMRILDVAINTPIPPERFALPPEVQETLKQAGNR